MRPRGEARPCAKCSQDSQNPRGASRLQWDRKVVAYPGQVLAVRFSALRTAGVRIGSEKAGSAAEAGSGVLPGPKANGSPSLVEQCVLGLGRAVKASRQEVSRS
jgi:hypothetical protein